MKEKIKKYRENIIGDTLYDVIKFLGLMFGSSVISSGVFTVIVSYLIYNKLLIVLVFVFLLILSLVIYTCLYSKYRKYKFKLLDVQVTIRINGATIVTKSKTRIIALRHNLNCIYNRYTWFDDEKSKVKCLNKNFKIKKLPRKDTSYEYHVYFDKVLNRHDEITYITQVKNSNFKKHFKNFYSREIIQPTAYLKMTIIIPSKVETTQITRSVICGSAYNDDIESKTFDFKNEHTWEIKSPKIGYEYKLDWK